MGLTTLNLIHGRKNSGPRRSAFDISNRSAARIKVGTMSEKCDLMEETPDTKNTQSLGKVLSHYVKILLSAGLAASLVLTRFINTMLYGVKSGNITTSF